MIRSYRYRASTIALECAQGAGGFALTAGLIAYAEPAGAVVWPLAAAAALFLVYFGRAVVRSLTRIELHKHGIRARGPWGSTIPWDELRSLRLYHYTTRSDRSGGWMQLDVRGARGGVRIDSSLVDFAGLAAVAGGEAMRWGQTLDESTRTNLRALGASPHG